MQDMREEYMKETGDSVIKGNGDSIEDWKSLAEWYYRYSIWLESKVHVCKCKGSCGGVKHVS